MIVNAVQG